MSEPERYDVDCHYTEESIPTMVLNIVFWGTLLGGMAIMVVFQVARLLIVEPFFDIELPLGTALQVLSGSMAFICSAGYAFYAVCEELKRREYCKQRGLVVWKD